MRARMQLALVLGSFAAVGGPAVAHHAFATYYLEQDTIEVEGTIVEFQYTNPHSWIHVQGEERSRQGVRIYAAEWVGTSRLERDGINARTLRAGDNVRLWAAPNRNPSDNRIHLKRVRRSDGWQWGANR
jgi:hypothetical protein